VTVVNLAMLMVPVVAGVALGWAAPRIGAALPPSAAVVSLTVAALTAALSTGLALAATGIFVVARLRPIAEAGHWSVRSLLAEQPLPTSVAAVATAAVAALLFSAIWHTGRTARELARTARLCRRLGSGMDIVIVNDPTPDAYALSCGAGGRIVVSTAMLRALPADQRRALLAHEAAHLNRHHHLFVLAGRLAAAANPVLRPVVAEIRVGIERWADEVAAAEIGDRRLTARSLTNAALCRHRAHGKRPAGALAATETMLVRRVRALLKSAPPPRPLITTAVAALVATMIATTGWTAHVTDNSFDRAQAAYRASAAP
jgi:Zn-dependent protease with chaperone function